jgi:REP element-mobilizing transposase RayT
MLISRKIVNRHSPRLKDHDYSQPGAYFVTICTQNRECLFGDVVGREMVLNEWGQIAYDELIKTVKLRENVEINEYIIMPNHIHCIIEISSIKKPDELPHQNDNRMSEISPKYGELGTIIRAYKSAVSYQIHHRRGVASQRPYNDIEQHPNIIKQRPTIWQRNYYEHIIRTDDDYHRIAQYIRNNPQNWSSDNENPLKPQNINGQMEITSC